MCNDSVAGFPKGGMGDVRETIPKLRLRMPPTHYSQKIVKPIF